MLNQLFFNNFLTNVLKDLLIVLPIILALVGVFLSFKIIFPFIKGIGYAPANDIYYKLHYGGLTDKEKKTMELTRSRKNDKLLDEVELISNRGAEKLGVKGYKRLEAIKSQLPEIQHSQINMPMRIYKEGLDDLTRVEKDISEQDEYTEEQKEYNIDRDIELRAINRLRGEEYKEAINKFYASS